MRTRLIILFLLITNTNSMKRLVLTVFFLAFVASVNATITRVQSVTANTGTSTTATSITFTPSAITAGNYVVIVMCSRAVDTWKVVPATVDKDWIGGVVAEGIGAAVHIQIFFHRVITGGQTSVVVSNLNAVVGQISGVLIEYSGKNITPDVWMLGNTGSSTAPATSTTDTTNYANELIIASMGQRGTLSSVQTSWASSPTNSFSIVAQTSSNVNTSNNDRAVAALERIVTSTGTYSTAVTSSINNSWTCGIATFREIPQVTSRMSGE